MDSPVLVLAHCKLAGVRSVHMLKKKAKQRNDENVIIFCLMYSSPEDSGLKRVGPFFFFYCRVLALIKLSN